MAASYREAIVEALVSKSVKAAQREGARTLGVAGGVAANSLLRRRLRERGEAAGLHVVVPPFAYCTDNAAMIGAAALHGPSLRLPRLPQRGRVRLAAAGAVDDPAVDSRTAGHLVDSRGRPRRSPRSVNDRKRTSMSQSFAYVGTSDYIAAPDLMQTVNVAVQLSRPLLIKGEPGTGKTMLAQSIARGLDVPLLIWNVKSTTKAQDGLYVYDTVQRLYDGQFGDRDVSDIAQYIKLGKLGEAFCSEERVVLLIDEIDKADLEFPNDLLWELDQMEFHIPETRQTIKAKHRPIVLITSNAEKELPDAFLRRCVFHYIEFPDKEMMERIVRVHVPGLDQRLLDLATQAFYWLRDVPGLQKKPSTSELIDWVQALERGGVDHESIAARLPFMGVLLKKDHDVDVAQRALASSRRR